MNKHYLHCPECRARMKLTGNKIEDTPAVSRDRESNWLYRREYECPKCGNFFTFCARMFTRRLEKVTPTGHY